MGYFRELPNLEYQNFLSDAISSQSYVLVKNLFRRNKLRDDLQNVFTIFVKYEIVEGARPDTIAEEYYNNSEFDWVVLLTAGIINVRNEWPLSNRNLYKYAEEIYGTKLNDLHHYETKEIKDSSGRLIMPAGKIVNEDFVLSYSEFTDFKKDENGQYIIDDDPDSPYYEKKIPLTENREKSGSQVRRGISNFEYESSKNEKKSSIYLLKKTYLQQFLNDMRNIMTYKDSSEKINSKLIRTENTNVVTR
tara:strand:+ start:1898 stop:2641 length:744 start_codon:yes stop_codon:yes gene_type:complete